MTAGDRASPDLQLRAANVSLEVVDPFSPAALTAMRSYFAELDARFPGGFDPGPAVDVSSMGPPGGRFVLAMSDGTPVACGGLQRIGEAIGEIKRMWVHEDWRGAGLGTRILRRLESEAAALGYEVVRLDTNRTLTEALAMYSRAGYREIERYNDNRYAQAFFEKVLGS